MVDRPRTRSSLWRSWINRRSLRAVALGFVVVGFVQAGRVEADPEETAPAVLEAVEIGAVKASTGGLLLSGQAGGDVEGALTWSLAGRDASGRVDVPFVVEIDGGTLLGGRIGRKMAIGIYAYVVDRDGRIIDFIAQGLLLDRDAYRDKIVGSGLKFLGRFSLEPGDFTLRVMVENSANRSYFMSWSILNVPSAEDPSPRLLPPLFPIP